VAGAPASLSRSSEAWRDEEIADRVTVPTQWWTNLKSCKTSKQRRGMNFALRSQNPARSRGLRITWVFAFERGFRSRVLSPIPNALKIRKRWITRQPRLTQIHCYGPFRFHQFLCRPSLLDWYSFNSVVPSVCSDLSFLTIFVAILKCRYDLSLLVVQSPLDIVRCYCYLSFCWNLLSNKFISSLASLNICLRVFVLLLWICQTSKIF
jgi:hypothetical protein